MNKPPSKKKLGLTVFFLLSVDCSTPSLLGKIAKEIPPRQFATHQTLLSNMPLTNHTHTHAER